MTNIRDLAREANVSVTTVSRVLNDHPYVANEKRRAVREAIEKLGYIRNQTAVHLSTGMTKTVGVMLPFVDHPYHAAILQGIAQAAFDASYRFLTWQTNYIETHEQLALDALAQQEIDALIIVSHSLPLSAILPYERYGPIVFCEHHEDVAAVYIDHYTAFQQGLVHLRQQGHTSIGICLGRPDSTNSLARKHAYEEVVSDAFVYEQTLTIEDGANVARRWMQQKQRPTAILTASDHVAAGLILELRKQGYQVPGDLSVIGFDGSELAEVLSMTTIAIPYATIGRHAFQLTVRKDTSARPQIEVPSAFISGTTVLPHT
ncbi:LacI family DNA-binding transcriptional regulator [Exiguobacterium acetylicum]|uniref:LacI family DNA-binding transcriptional regulator n=1 Tax=Exiguobacterium acetylicum TaxID=41170 RepID=UPI001EE176BF|nr:LacI family DNA-binding transcriptional regulator [Exiguobacterium acetylicum]UKS55954.1 LacI family DNA-binding transcriptional regulator [Exiguobacterium acetylicum]